MTTLVVFLFPYSTFYPTLDQSARKYSRLQQSTLLLRSSALLVSSASALLFQLLFQIQNFSDRTGSSLTFSRSTISWKWLQIRKKCGLTPYGDKRSHLQKTGSGYSWGFLKKCGFAPYGDTEDTCFTGSLPSASPSLAICPSLQKGPWVALPSTHPWLCLFWSVLSNGKRHLPTRSWQTAQKQNGDGYRTL